jgi:hypothetical protein
MLISVYHSEGSGSSGGDEIFHRTSAITGTGLLAVGVCKQPECQHVCVRWIALFGLFLL